MLSYGLLSDCNRAQLIKTHPELVAAFTQPYVDSERLCIVGDFTTILYALDALTDGQDTQGSKATQDTFERALKGDSGDDTSPVTQFTKEQIPYTPDELLQRFVMHFIGYMDATLKEATLRTDGKIPTFEEYVPLRRRKSGLFPVFNILEIVLGVTLPTAVLEDDQFQVMVLAANDILCLANAYAMDRAAELYKASTEIFVASKASVRSFGPKIDEMVRAYVYALEQWICGHNAFNTITQRFFGEKTEEVNRTGIVKLKV